MFAGFKAGYPGRFARRLFVWFIMATALPVVLLSVVAYQQVHRQLEEEAYLQLHRVAKTIGLYLYARLDELDTRLGRLAPVADQVRAVPGVRELVAVEPSMMREVPLLGSKAVLAVTRQTDGSRQVLLIPHAWRLAYGLRHAVLVAPEVLQAPAELLPAEITYCLAGDDDVPVTCGSSGDLPASLSLRVAELRHSNSSGTLAWQSADKPSLAAYWSIFLRGRFTSHDWVVVVSRDAEGVYASMAPFHTLLPQVLVLSVILAMLLALIQLRLRLTPLGRVLEATRRFASGDFSARVETGGSDELSLLADAFNHMAAHTDLQFKRLAGLAELDRLILSSFEEDKIVSITLERIQELVGCKQVAFIAPPRHGQRVRVISNHRAQDVSGRQGLEPVFTGWLTELVGPVSVVPAELRHWPIAAGSEAPTLFPVCHQKKCFGAILVEWRSVDQQMEFLGVLNEFSDRLAVALSNAAWEGELTHQAHYDALTGLANRALLNDRLEQALLRADRNGSRTALLFIDLDAFKTVNDTLGHQVGDAYLVTAAHRLREAARAAETVVRFGGDEFVILITDIPAEEDLVRDLTATAERLIEVVSQPVELEGRRVALGASIGIAVYPGDGKSADELLRNADAAMYHAKARGRGHAEFYAEEMNRDALERLALQQEFSAALKNGQELFLVFQPQVCAQSGRVTGVEALSRWKHPTRGIVSPVEFIPLAEESGLIVHFGEWVLRQACMALRDWWDQGLQVPRLAVNVAPNQFWTPGFLDTVKQILADTRLPAEALELEVTEGTVMGDLERGKQLLGQLDAMGIRLSVDDFGTGYSSLSYLQWLPLHALKIDRSFVIRMGDGGVSDAIVAAIIALGKRLGLRLIAEGVDDPAQVEMLRELECDELQGFLYSEPLTSEALMAWYREYEPAGPAAHCE